ncbi:sortase A [Enterococcus sp. DIV0840]
MLILFLIIGTLLICFPIFKNTITIIKIKNTKITQVENMPEPKPNERIDFPTVEDYLTASTDNLEDAVGQLMIESVGISVPIFLGVHYQEMLFGVGFMHPDRHFEKDNIVLLGHHLGIENLLLGKIAKIEVNDLIKVQFLDKIYQYKIVNKKIVLEDQLEVLDNTATPQLTIITCDKPYLTDKRIIVTAEPVKEKRTEAVKNEEKNEFYQNMKAIRKSFVKYSVVPIVISLIALILSGYCIWKYV